MNRPAAASAAFEVHRLAVETCVACPLAATRARVVFGAGTPASGLMLLGEAPGAQEDEQGVPFAGASGRLIDELLAQIGLARGSVFITNVLRCRPPGNRDPEPKEIAACEQHLFKTLELVEPRVLVTLGNFPTKLLLRTGRGIAKVHGQEEDVTIAGHQVLVYPVFHPASAVDAPAVRRLVDADFARIPELLARVRPVPAEAPPVEEHEQLLLAG